MSYYWAKFEQRNHHLFRFDTRVYLNMRAEPTINDICIGAVVGKNPGSARPHDTKSLSMQKIQLENDQLLPNIRSILCKSYQKARKPIPNNSYVQVLNLFYICDSHIDQAIKKLEAHPHSLNCETEANHFPFIWYVWGGNHKKLNFYKSRILNIKSDNHFYLDTKTNKVTNAAPRLSDSARHTQGMKHDHVVPYISSIL